MIKMRQTAAPLRWEYLYSDRLCPIEEALRTQERRCEQKLIGDPYDYIIFAEHEPVYTCTSRWMPKLDELCKVPPPQLPAPFYEIRESRGGSITYHGPGQLVCYFVTNISRLGINGAKFCHLLDQIVIETLAEFEVHSHPKPRELPDEVGGVWITTDIGVHKKLAARGVRAARKYAWQKKVITTGGIAPNICTDLSYFDAIYPCGHDFPMTSVREITGKTYDLQEVAAHIAEIAARTFGNAAELHRTRSSEANDGR